MKIKTVTILGANGNMGSQCAGIIAGFGNAKVYMIARNLEKAQVGVEKAIDSIKSDAIRTNLIPKTYDDLKECLKDSDWIVEIVAEDPKTKHTINQQITQYKRPGAIVSTVSSGLSINQLAQDFSPEEQKYYFCTHFFNPPYKILLCELVSNANSNPKIQEELKLYLQNTLHRKVVITNDTPGFAGNRIGFQLLNEAVQFSLKYPKEGGIAYIDYLLGGFAGHALPPIATIDLVGLDVHRAIVNNISNLTNDHAHETFKMPKFMEYLISHESLGNKTGHGLYQIERDQKLVFNISKNIYETIPKLNLDLIERVKEKISNGEYSQAYKLILESDTIESQIIQHFFARYLSYSLSLVGTVVKTKENVDQVMAYGFNWLPPCALIDLIGGKNQAIKLIKKFKMIIPNSISQHSSTEKFYTLQNILDYRSFIKAY